jgi:acetyltransferase-like isoleucine patch superfamily enzyme
MRCRLEGLVMTNDVENISLGKNSKIGENVILGEENKSCRGKKLILGDNAVIRSHTVVYLGNEIGDDFQTGHGVLIRENNKIGNKVSLGTHSVIERDNIIGNGVRIHTACFIPEYVIIEDEAWLGPRVTILNVLHPPCPKADECSKHVVIKKNAKIGGNVTIGPRVTIGQNALVGFGSVVTKDVPDDTVVSGNPAKPMKKVKELDCVIGEFKIPYEWES